MENCEAKYCISLTMWPNCERLWEFDFRAFMRISESPSNTPLLRTVSKANSIARLAANASTSLVILGRGIRCAKDTITCPSLSLIATPIPAWFSALKSAPSKLILYCWCVAGCHWVGGLPMSSTSTKLCSKKSCNLLRAYCTRFGRVSPLFPTLMSFLLFHTAHTIMANRSGSLFSARIHPMRSTKLIVCRRLHWFHACTESQISSNFGQR